MSETSALHITQEQFDKAREAMAYAYNPKDMSLRALLQAALDSLGIEVIETVAEAIRRGEITIQAEGEAIARLEAVGEAEMAECERVVNQRPQEKDTNDPEN